MEAGSRALAEALARLDGASIPKAAKAQPSSASDAAVESYGRCFALLVRQPIGIEAPTVLDEAQLATAQRSCQAAVKADPGLSSAWAALALAQTLAGADEGALESLSKVKPAGGVPMYWLARFWLVARYQSSDAGPAVWREALEKEKGFLLARSYLAENLNALDRHAEAATAWQEYNALCPGNPYILMRMAYTLARLGKPAEAVKFSEQALAFDPSSPDMVLEVASRYIDAGALDKAIALLEPLAAKPDARAELLLRLGYAHILKGNAAPAQTLLTRAFQAAKAPSEWRTRGRAKLDLARLAMDKGEKDKARALLAEALKEGVRPKAKTPAEKALLALAKPEELAPVKGLPGPKETSPYALSPGGEVDPASARPAPPKGFAAIAVKAGR